MRIAPSAMVSARNRKAKAEAIEATNASSSTPAAAAAVAAAPPSDAAAASALRGRRATALNAAHFNSVFYVILLVRTISAFNNLIHDCDEVFNFFEPLHYLVHGWGLQTWEHSARYALRSYLYLGAHYAVMKPAALIAQVISRKKVSFYLFRFVLGFVSAKAETRLYRAIHVAGVPSAASYYLLFLLVTTGMFAAPTTFLPSTTAMVALTWAAAGVLEGSRPGLSRDQRMKHVAHVIFAACIGVGVAWPVCGVAFLPYALWVLAVGPWIPSFGALFLGLSITIGPGVLIDSYFYGRRTLSLANFVAYNVIGGGDSHLYGVEGPRYYLINGLLNFGPVWVLALVFPVWAIAELLLQLAPSGGPGGITGLEGPLDKDHGASAAAAPPPRPSNRYSWHLVALLTAVAPLYVWVGTLSLPPHKEERFMYVVYPLICLAGALSLQSLEVFLRSVIRVPAPVSNRLMGMILGATTVMSMMRTAALLAYYGAPMGIWAGLPAFPPPPMGLPPEGRSSNTSIVCVGGEWYRFPSSFWLPSDKYRLGFVRSSFTGMLPRYFPEGPTLLDGTRSAPPDLNDRNQQVDSQYVPGLQHCSYLVQLATPDAYVAPWNIRRTSKSLVGSDKASQEKDKDSDEQAFGARAAEPEWELLVTGKFLDAANTPTNTRVLYLPGVAERQNKYFEYQLLRRVRAWDGRVGRSRAESEEAAPSNDGGIPEGSDAGTPGTVPAEPADGTDGQLQGTNQRTAAGRAEEL